MALLNVRLDAKDAQRVKELRRSGVAISTLVRDAIRAAYDERVASASRAHKRSRLVAEIIAELPEPEGSRSRHIDASNRELVRRHIRAKLGRSRS